MTQRIAWLAAAIVGPVLVIGVVVATPGDERQPPPVPTLPADEPSPAVDREPASTLEVGERRAASTPDRNGGETDEGFREPGTTAPLASEELWADIADPSNSDLPHDVFHAAVDLAAAVVVADTTGEGRGRWPAYWRGHRSQPCCHAVTIHAAGARSHPEAPGNLSAAVVWTGKPNSEVVGTYDEQVTYLRLVPIGNGGWKPAR